jgi:hypothetical protein
MTEKRYLTISSQERDPSSNSPADFFCSVRQGINFKHCMLIMSLIPNTYYNITNNNNGILINTILRKVTPGNYNLDELFNEFITIDSNILGITYDDTLSIVTITVNAGTQISFPSTGSINYVLGFPASYNQTAASHISSFPPSLAKFNLYIEIDQLSSNHTTTNAISGLFTYEVPNNVNKNEIIQYYNKTHYNQVSNCKSNGEVLYNLVVKVKNQYNEIVSGLADWTCVLCFY